MILYKKITKPGRDAVFYRLVENRWRKMGEGGALIEALLENAEAHQLGRDIYELGTPKEVIKTYYIVGAVIE